MSLPDGVRDTAVGVAWRWGRLRYKLKPIQRRMVEEWESGKHHTRKHVLHVSRRLGKSTLLFILALEACLQKANARVAFVAPVERRLEDYISSIATKIMVDCPSTVRPTYLSQKNIFRFKNGSELIFAGSNNQSYNSLRGFEFDQFFVDEAAFIDNLPELIEDVAMPTLFHTKGYLILSSSSPITPEHPFKTYAEKAILNNAYSMYTIEDDETLDKEQVEEWISEAGGRESTRVQREYFCKFTTDEERALTPSWNDKFIKSLDKDEFFQFYHLYEAMDLGFKRDFTCIAFGYYNYKKQIVQIEDEIVIKGPELTSKKLADMIKAKEGILWPLRDVYRRISDNDDLIFLNTMSVEQNLHFTPTGKDSLHEMIDRLNGFLRDGKLLIAPKCKYLIACLKSGIWDKERKKLDRSEALGHYDGTMALAYLLQNLDIWSIPIPNLYNADPRNVMFRPGIDTESNELASLKKLFKEHREQLL